MQSALPLTKCLHHRCVILGLESLHGFRLLGNGLSFGMGIVGGVAAELGGDLGGVVAQLFNRTREPLFDGAVQQQESEDAEEDYGDG